MVIGKICSQSGALPLDKQLEEFLCIGGAQLAAAVAANVALLYLSGVEDVIPGVIVGTTTTISLSLVHRTTHAKNGRIKKNLDRMDYWRNFTLLIITSSASSWYVLKYFDYPAKLVPIARMFAVSVISIAAVNKFALEDTQV